MNVLTRLQESFLNEHVYQITLHTWRHRGERTGKRESCPQEAYSLRGQMEPIRKKMNSTYSAGSQTQPLNKPSRSSTSRAGVFLVWSVFVFSWSAQTGHTGASMPFCSLHIVSPWATGPSPATDVVCMTMSEADGWKSREGVQILTPQLMIMKNLLLVCMVKVSQAAI